jgi:hypothetical protein
VDLPERIARRVARALGDEGLVDKLIALPQSELTSLLLEVTRQRQRSVADLAAQFARVAAVRPSPTDARQTAAVETEAFAAAEGFDAIALSPVAPLGINAVLGEVDQNSTLAALRGMEVLADPTTVMALECVSRRRAGAAEVRLCAAGRMLRMQPFDNPAFSPHFALFALVTAGRDRGSLAFELAALAEQVRAHLRLFARLEAIGFRIAEPQVEIADTAHDDGRLARVESELFPSLRAEFPAVTCTLDRERTHAMAYYHGLCMHITARDTEGMRQQISDGGFVDWTQRLGNNAKERLLVSGLGTELFPRRFR